MAKQNNVTEQWFKDKGYFLNTDGSWSPPQMKSKYIKVQAAKNVLEEIELVIKEKVNSSPDFKIIPSTEWFITNYNVPSKKNSRQNFKNGISIPSEKHAEYVKMTAMQYDAYGKEFRNAVEYFDLKYPLRIEFTFIRSSKKSFDYGNALQTCEDIMKDEYKKIPTDKIGKNGKRVKKFVLVKQNWFPDDSADYLLPSFKPYEYDKENPGVRIKLLITKR